MTVCLLLRVLPKTLSHARFFPDRWISHTLQTQRIDFMFIKLSAAFKEVFLFLLTDSV